jgi:hypothetical protein
MKRRKLELALVVLAVAVAALLFRESPAPEKVGLARPTQPTATVNLPKVQLSEDAKWLITTAADSYTPRVKVEKAWQDGEDDVPRG